MAGVTHKTDVMFYQSTAFQMSQTLKLIAQTITILAMIHYFTW